MKIQFAAVLKDRRGNDILDEDKTGLTLATVCAVVLDTIYQDEANEGYKPKLRRSELIERITQAEKTLMPLDLLDSDIEMLKERIGKRNLSPQVTAQAIRLLDTPGLEAGPAEVAGLLATPVPETGATAD